MALRVTEAIHFGIPKFDGEGEPDKLSFSPDGTRIAAGETRWTTVWTLDGKRVWTAAPGGRPVWLTSDRVLTTGFTNQPCLFSAESGEINGAMDATAHDAVALGTGVFAIHGKFADEKSGLTVMNLEGEILAEEGEMLPFDNEGRMRMGFGDMEIVSLCASANGQRIAVSRRKGTSSTLHVADASLSAGWSIDASAVAFALDVTGDRLAVATGKSVTLYDGATGAKKSQIPLEGGVHALAFSPDGTLAAGLDQGRGVVFLDVATGKTTGTFVPDGLAADERIASLAFSPDGKHLAAGLSARLTVRDMTSGRELGGAPAHTRGTHFAAILPGAAVIVTRGPTSTKVWTLGSGELKATHTHDEEKWPIPPLEAGAGGVLFDAGADGVIRLRDALRWEAAGSVAVTGESKPLRATSLTAAPEAKRIAALFMTDDPNADGLPECTVRVFDLASGAQLRVFGRDPLPAPPPPPPDPELDQFRRPREGGPTPHKPEHESRIALSPDGKLLAFTTRNQDFDEAVHVVEVDTGKHRGHVPADLGGVKTLAFLSNERLLSGTPGNEVRASTIAATVQPPEAVVQDAALPTLSPSRALLASWNPMSGGVELRETSALSADPVIAAERIGLTKLLFSEDERFLGAILQDGSVRVWSLSR